MRNVTTLLEISLVWLDANISLTQRRHSTENEKIHLNLLTIGRPRLIGDLVLQFAIYRARRQLNALAVFASSNSHCIDNSDYAGCVFGCSGLQYLGGSGCKREPNALCLGLCCSDLPRGTLLCLAAIFALQEQKMNHKKRSLAAPFLLR